MDVAIGVWNSMTKLPHINTIYERREDNQWREDRTIKQRTEILRRISDGLRVGEHIAIMSEVPELEDYILYGELHSAQEWIESGSNTLTYRGQQKCRS